MNKDNAPHARKWSKAPVRRAIRDPVPAVRRCNADGNDLSFIRHRAPEQESHSLGIVAGDERKGSRRVEEPAELGCGPCVGETERMQAGEIIETRGLRRSRPPGRHGRSLRQLGVGRAQVKRHRRLIRGLVHCRAPCDDHRTGLVRRALLSRDIRGRPRGTG